MLQLVVSYSVWTQMVDNNPSWSLYHAAKGDGLVVVVGHRDAQFISHAFGDDLTDFNTDHLASSTAVSTKEDGIALCIGAVPPKPLNYDGVPLFAPTFLHTNDQVRLQAYALSCEPEGVGIIDVETTTQLLVQGGQFWAMNPSRGDKASFSIVDKNDVLGLHTLHEIELGTPIELIRYVTDYNLPTTDLWREDVVMPTVAPVAPGLFLRLIYEAAAGGTTRHASILYRWYIGD